MKALWRGWCAVCDREFGTGDDIAQRKDKWVHVRCMAGGDES
jgi:hypothetical protein